MKNETIKNYTPITVAQAGDLLRDNDWQPVDGMALKHGDGDWNHVNLKGISVGNGHKKFVGPHEKHFSDCATVTEIDPCVAPDGCPELEDWQALVHVGDGKTIAELPVGDYLWFGIGENEGKTEGWEIIEICPGGTNHYAVDVRTAWAKREYPDHCRIRAYSEPSPVAEEHNPDQLTEEQVGVADGWRLLMAKEIHSRGCALNDISVWRGDGRWSEAAFGSNLEFTYRTKQPAGHFLPQSKSDPFEDRWQEMNGSVIHGEFGIKAATKMFYELGQANPLVDVGA